MQVTVQTIMRSHVFPLRDAMSSQKAIAAVPCVCSQVHPTVPCVCSQVHPTVPLCSFRSNIFDLFLGHSIAIRTILPESDLIGKARDHSASEH